MPAGIGFRFLVIQDEVVCGRHPRRAGGTLGLTPPALEAVASCLSSEIYVSEANILTRKQGGRTLLPRGRQPRAWEGTHMSATLAIRHHVRDYAAWRKVYDEVEPLRAQYGCIRQRVLRLPDDGNELLVAHDFSSAEQAASFAHDPALREAMGRAGVEGAPRIEIFTDV